MIDPMISLAFAVYSNKGAYALLLGSGISRSSGIPTGWEVVLDFVKRVAALEAEDCEPDPAQWFRDKHSAEPDYSKLLDELAKTPTERQQLLRSYFEPSADERSQGLKLPTAGHKAIAELASSGYLRVILTTNFDRLMERALEDVGITPTVISTADQIQGALPLAHSGVTVIKLHGDYLDTRIKNTEGELSDYAPELNSLLDRILDDYGLIISGWSGDWDIALRAALERCPNRRFSTFWTTRSTLSSRAKTLAEHRRAAVVQAKDADALFQTLSEKVKTLEDLASPHPLSAKMAAATIKRYLVDPSAKIRLRDLVHEETEKLFQETSSPAFGGNMTGSDHEKELLKRTQQYEALCETMIAILVPGCYWGDAQSTKLWVKAIQRIANPGENNGGLSYLLSLRRYPVLLLMYAAGIASLAAENYETLASILTKPTAKNAQYEPEAICSIVYPGSVVEKDIARLLPGLDRRHTPLNDHLFVKLREPLREFLSSDEEYTQAFDRFEYLLGLVHADLNRQDWDGWWGPVGCFAWRGRHMNQERKAAFKIGLEIDAHGDNWAALKAGLFKGSLSRAKEAKTKFDQFLSHVKFF